MNLCLLTKWNHCFLAHCTLEWLSSTAKCVVEKYIVPKESKDPVYVYVVPKESKDSIYVLCHSSLCGILVYRPEKANPI